MLAQEAAQKLAAKLKKHSCQVEDFDTAIIDTASVSQYANCAHAHMDDGEATLFTVVELYAIDTLAAQIAAILNK